MSATYDASLPDQHAQLLFDHVDHPEHLAKLYAWLSVKHLDANVLAHTTLLDLIRVEAANGPEASPMAHDAALCWED